MNFLSLTSFGLDFLSLNFSCSYSSAINEFDEAQLAPEILSILKDESQS